ncbi:MAG TPA: leucine-rich repeat domain-containing protein [Candidatus Paceibacterota bacterium]|nr:leucine-rich repeat domain-containing protein [Candidatus Paceibacterota bacterium]
MKSKTWGYLVGGLLVCGSAAARPALFGGFEYEYSDINVTITRFTGAWGNVTIPESFPPDWFLPVTSIRGGAFSGCTALTSVTIPNTVTNIGREAFDGCTSLIAITIGPLNPIYSSLEGVLFNKDQTTLLRCPGGKSGSYTIPNTVTSIGDWGFYGCVRLTGVMIPDSVTNIGDGSFSDCARLTTITIPESVTSIGIRAFSGCANLTAITIPDSVFKIGEEAFSGCASLRAVVVDSSNTAYSSLDGILFSKSQTTLIRYPMGKEGSYVIPNYVTNIGPGAFSGNTHLTGVMIPNSIMSIEEGAFSGCTNLTSVTIPNSITNIEKRTFSGCASLTTITIPDSVTSIGCEAFAECLCLTNVTIGDRVIRIEDWTFQNCVSLASVTIGNGVISIGNEAFRGCTSLASMEIGNSVTNIGGGAFSTCTSLASVTIPNSVTSIGGYAFSDCTSLGSVTIPNSVVSIEGSAFRGWVAGAFSFCTSLTNVTVGSGVASIGEVAFFGCDNLTGIYFHGDAPTIEGLGGVFPSLTTVYYLPGTAGWATTFGDCPTAFWVLPNPMILKSSLSRGMEANPFGFVISWATNASVVVEACTELADPTWLAIGTNTLLNGVSHFSDPEWSKHPAQFYRLRSP